MPKYWYYEMACLHFAVALPIALLNTFFILGFPWGYIALAFALGGHYFRRQFNRLHTTPEE